MTVAEFRDDVIGWYDLIEFCRDNDIADYVEDVISDDDLDEYIDEDIRDALEYENWRYVRDCLADIDTGYFYYRRDGRFDYVGLDEYSLEDVKVRIIEEMGDDLFDAPEDEPAEEEAYEETEDEFSPADTDYAAFVEDINEQAAELRARLSELEEARERERAICEERLEREAQEFRRQQAAAEAAAAKAEEEGDRLFAAFTKDMML